MAVTLSDSGIIRNLLEEIYAKADALPRDISAHVSGIDEDTLRHCDALVNLAPKATSGWVNLITCFICKALNPEIDTRYHRPPGRGMPAPPSGPGNYFTGRGISEEVVGPWLRSKEFVTANSGWQTRTYERPRPYNLDYPENIGYIKEQFLNLHDRVQVHLISPREVLKYLFYKAILWRDSCAIDIAAPLINDIGIIMGFLERHFFHDYHEYGASRLPVLAVYAVYRMTTAELARYEGKLLKPLQPHVAADTRTGAIGDIEIINDDGSKFEGVEVKHEISITPDIINTAYLKFSEHRVERYYLLTTASDHFADKDTCQASIEKIKTRHGCQVIINGVLRTIYYYLRLVRTPGVFFSHYAELLNSDSAIKFEHREFWNLIISE